MAEMTQPDKDMDSLYGDEAPKTEAPKESVDQEEAEADSTIVPNKILSPDGEPLKPGDEVVLQVVENYGDECEVKYAPKKGGESKGEMEPEEELESMSTKEGY